ncbi:MAG: alpha-amylase family glycosyl hydrolase [Anaerolineales bacterium]
MTHLWVKDAIFYHIYPLGLCGAPDRNDFIRAVEHRLDKLHNWLDHIQNLGANALYLGPLFQSTSHGYDTADYYQVDRRLGNNDTLTHLAEDIHQRGMYLVLDAVFNHVGRDFWAFKDVQIHGENSAYRDWFQNLKFGERSPKGDPFQYESWQGHYSLVKLNLAHPHVRAHLFDAVGMWMDRFGIDGLRLDAADCIDFDFLQALNVFTKAKRPDFWLMGEVVHGDYREWVNASTLDSVTNYACYKGLYSSLVDRNYYEIAYNLDRQFGSGGIYRELMLYNFVDNHDVDRVASKLLDLAQLNPLYLLLFTMPGIPSIYYGSEWGIKGKKGPWSDKPLRPELALEDIQDQAPLPQLAGLIECLAAFRKRSKALSLGNYLPIHVAHQQFVFQRQFEEEKLLIALNSSAQNVEVTLPFPKQSKVVDILNRQECFNSKDGFLRISLPPHWGRILKFS